MHDDPYEEEPSGSIIARDPQLAAAVRNLCRAFFADMSEEDRLEVAKSLSVKERIHGLDPAAREEMIALLLAQRAA